MSAPGGVPDDPLALPSEKDDRPRACVSCARRGWLIGQLSAILDYRVRDFDLLDATMALDDQALIAALGGSRGPALREDYRSLPTSELDRRGVCRHDCGYPRTLRERGAHPILYTPDSSGQRLGMLLDGPAVAIVGARRASDHGMTLARHLAAALASASVTVVCGLEEGIATAVALGTLEARGPIVAVAAGGLDMDARASSRPLHRRLCGHGGCVISRLPRGTRARRWSVIAREATIASLADAVVAVEGESGSRDLRSAEAAIAAGVPVGALPGRVTSPLAGGTNELIRRGATLLRDATDVLDLLFKIPFDGGPAHEDRPPPSRDQRAEMTGLSPRLLAVLARVAQGDDTVDRLAVGELSVAQARVALGELELAGSLVRGDGGRYVPTGRII